jgi:hypothetical protein
VDLDAGPRHRHRGCGSGDRRAGAARVREHAVSGRRVRSQGLW